MALQTIFKMSQIKYVIFAVSMSVSNMDPIGKEKKYSCIVKNLLTFQTNFFCLPPIVGVITLDRFILHFDVDVAHLSVLSQLHFLM